MGFPSTLNFPQNLNYGPLGYSGGQNSGGVLGTGNALSLINPSDIESINVLKDADATAIYGSKSSKWRRSDNNKKRKTPVKHPLT